MSTIPALFLAQATHAPARVVAHVPEPDGAGWRWLPRTFGEGLDEISGLARRLAALGVQRGVPVAIVAQTSHRWAACDLAILSLGGITVGLYPTLTGPQLARQLAHSEAAILLLDGPEVHARLAPHLDDLPDLQHVFSLTPVAGLPQLHPARPDVPFLRQQVEAVRPEMTATYVYTSGTTAEPKAAVLTHSSFVATVLSSQQALPMRAGERTIIYLPLAHSLQRFAQYRGLVEEGQGWYAPSLAALPETIAAARPTVLPVVPRVLEKIRARAESTAAARGPVSAVALAWAVAVGRTFVDQQRTGRVDARIIAQHALAERLVYRRIRRALGGALRMVISGGAALSVDDAGWFEAIGISVREGWGLTETCAPATLSRESGHRAGSIGRPMPGVTVEIAEDGELLVAGPGLFSGYLKDPDATAAAFTPAGLFRTGDIGAVDADGFFYITGRKKELIITAGGKNISPAPIELSLEGGIIGQAVVIGDGRPYLTALLALDPELLAERAAAAGWPGDFAAWSARPELQAIAAQRVAQVNATLARFQTIKHFAVLPAPLTVATGELTATLKKRRSIITTRCAHLIAAMYGGPDTSSRRA